MSIQTNDTITIVSTLNAFGVTTRSNAAARLWPPAGLLVSSTNGNSVAAVTNPISSRFFILKILKHPYRSARQA